MVLYGSNFGDANKHTTTNMPTIFAGCGFRHGQHLAFDVNRNYPLPNLFVTMLQRMGIESDQFASSTGTMRGFEAKSRAREVYNVIPLPLKTGNICKHCGKWG